jgi:hypothetical protein
MLRFILYGKLGMNRTTEAQTAISECQVGIAIQAV